MMQCYSYSSFKPLLLPDMESSLKFFDSRRIESVAGFGAWVDTMHEAFGLRRGNDFIMPQRSHIDFGENTLLLMPCIGSEFFATKIVSVFPGNTLKGIPQVNGIVVLNSMDNGEPLAVFDGASLTAMRTAAVGSFGVRMLAPRDASTLGIIGAGKQGTYQAIAACSQRDFRKIFVYDSSPGNIASSIERIRLVHPDIEVITPKSAEELCRSAEVIITATSSSTPVLPDSEELLRGKTVIGIGSYKPGFREFPDALFRLSGRIYIDSEDGIGESGDLIYPLEKGFLGRDDLISGYQMVTSGFEPGETRVFKSVGMALFDLYAAIMVYRRDRSDSK